MQMNSMKATHSTDDTTVFEESFMGHLMSEHNVALSLVCISGLVIGLPLAVNKFWHLQVFKKTSKSNIHIPIPGNLDVNIFEDNSEIYFDNVFRNCY